ncbi:hypothetical protein DBY21_07655 [Candidatus Gastranaerophilales bacterium]|nr:MAG: hypothetical protein DBY21_07655 [Candidatus Gastranaerophilales bacterium]
MIMDNTMGTPGGFDLSPEILDEIQSNIEEIIKSFPISETNKMDVIKKINFMYTQTKYMSVTDALTGLYNRRHFENTLEREFLRAQRYSNDLSLAVLDVDFFKKINDTYGHLCGDYVLKEIAYMTLQTFRKTDIVFRYGGEEIVILLTETPLEKAIIPLERLRKTIEDYPFNYDSNGFKVTVSIGVEGLEKEHTTAEDLLQNADKALYAAKELGRNRVVTSSDL